MTTPRLVELARVAAGLTQGELAKRLSKTQPFVSQVERGERELPGDLVEAWAHSCGVPPSFFRRTEEPLADSLAGVVHRRLKTLPAKPFNYATARVKLICLEIDSLFSEVEVEPGVQLPDLPFGTGPGDAAASVRRLWRIPDGPLPNITELIESAAIPIVLLDAFHEKHSATSHRGKWFDWAIIVNSGHPPSRRRFTIAHELGHIVLKHDRAVPVVGSDDETIRAAQLLEDEANAFAADLLLPEDDARRELRTLTMKRLVALKMRWQVSISFLIMRGFDLGLLTDDGRQRLYRELSGLPGGRRREPAEFDAEEPKLVRRMIKSLAADGYTLAEVAEMITADEQTLRTRYLGEPPPIRPVRPSNPRTHLRLLPPSRTNRQQ